MADDDSLTLVSVITAPDDDPDSVARTLAWRIPTELAAEFAEGMTERFGPPVTEALSTVGAMVEASRQDDQTIYLSEEAPGA